MCYINSSLHLRMVGWIGDPLNHLLPHLYADADLAGCVTTQRSTSGVFFSLRGPSSCWPISGYSKSQGCVSYSTPEAEIIAACFALRIVGLPAQALWEILLPHSPCIIFHEDNTACARIIETGRNPTMRYLARTHRISIAWLCEVCKQIGVNLVIEESSKMAGDIFTKGFTDPLKWAAAQQLINIFDPKVLDRIRENPTILEAIRSKHDIFPAAPCLRAEASWPVPRAFLDAAREFFTDYETARGKKGGLTVGQSPTPDESVEVSYQRSKLDGTTCDDGTNYLFDSGDAAASSSYNGAHIAALPVTIAYLPHAGPPGGAGAAGESRATVSRASLPRGTLCVDTRYIDANPDCIDKEVSVQDSDMIHESIRRLVLQPGSATKHIHLGLHTRHRQVGPKTRYLADHAVRINTAIKLLLPACGFQGITIHQGKKIKQIIFTSAVNILCRG